MHFDTVWMVEIDNNFKLSVGILGVLVDFFYRDFSFIFFSFSFVNDSKGSLTDDFHPIILGTFIFFLLSFNSGFRSLFFLGIFEGGKQRLIFVEKVWIDLHFLIMGVFSVEQIIILIHYYSFKRFFEITFNCRPNIACFIFLKSNYKV